MAGGIGGMINREAMAGTPPQVFNLYTFFISFVISLAGGMHGANTSNISGILAMKEFKKTFGLSNYSAAEKTNISGWVTSVIVLGGLIGALTSAPLADRLGRKWTLWIHALIFTVGTIVQLIANGNINEVIGGRAMQGFSSGGGSVVGTLFLAELAPKAIRGILGTFFSINVIAGVALGYWTDYIAIVHISDTSAWQWRFPTLFQIYPGIILLIGLPFVQESPRWLALRERHDEAISALCRIRRLDHDDPFILEEYGEISHSVDVEKHVGTTSSWLGLFSELKRDRTLLRRFLIVMVVQIGFNFSGGNSITYYLTSILETIGVGTTAGDYLYSGIYGLIKVLAVCVYAFWATERLGRRFMLLVGASVNILCVTYVAIFLRFLSHNTSAGKAAIAMINIFAFFYGSGWSPIAFGLNGEVFPNRVRAKIMSLTLGMQYLCNFLLTRFFPNMVANIGSYGPFAIFAGVSTVITTYLYFALPETKGIAIEHMGTLFGNRWYLNGVRQPSELPSLDSSIAENQNDKVEQDYVENIAKMVPAEQ